MSATKSNPNPAPDLAARLAELRDQLYQLASTLAVADRGIDPDASDPEAFPLHSEATAMIALTQRVVHSMALDLDQITQQVRP